MGSLRGHGALEPPTVAGALRLDLLGSGDGDALLGRGTPWSTRRFEILRHVPGCQQVSRKAMQQGKGAVLFWDETFRCHLELASNNQVCERCAKSGGVAPNRWCRLAMKFTLRCCNVT